MARSVDEARQAIRDVLGATGLSMRAVSAAMGRDADYVAAFLDPRRRTRARPTPDDLVGLSDATGVPFVELLDRVWGITPGRLAAELTSVGQAEFAAALARLTEAERAQVTDYARFLVASRPRSNT
jgi:transcriptional regulator with XRE-family HTH domain